MRSRRAKAVVLALAGALLLSACQGEGPLGPPQPRDAGLPVERMECVDPFGESAGDAPQAGTIPDGFVVAAVYRCRSSETRTLADGAVWSGALVERFEGDLAPFLQLIGGPSDPEWNGACPANLVIAPDVWAQDAAGRYLRLSYPANGCAQPKVDEVDAAPADLEAVDEVFTPLNLVESPEARASGCATRAAVLVVAEFDVGGGTVTTPEAWPSPRVGVAPAASGGASALRVCIYAAEPPIGPEPQLLGDGGVFAEVRELAAASAAEAYTALTQAPPAPRGCTQTATRFATVHPIAGSVASAPFTVEFDGCSRVIDRDLNPGVASPQLLALLQSAG